MNIVFQSFGCCYANQVTIIEQSAKGNTTNDITLYPPCVQRYMAINCPQISLSNNYCQNGTNVNVTISQGYVKFASIPTKLGGLPNMYSETSILTLQQVIVQALLQTSNPANTPTPQILFATNVQITNYTYYNGTVALTPSNGLSVADHSDYTDATNAEFWFNLVTVYGSETASKYNDIFIASQGFYGYVAVAYYGAPISVTSTTTHPNYFYAAEQFPLHPNTGSSYSFNIYITITCILCMVFTNILF